jgi:hypothetical protein
MRRFSQKKDSESGDASCCVTFRRLTISLCQFSLRKLVSASDVQNAEESFHRICSDLASRRRSLDHLRHAPTEESQQAGMLGRWWGSSQRSKEIKSLQQEIFGLETLASAMRDDLDTIRGRHRQAVWSSTIQGKILLGIGHFFSIYCIWRIILAALSLVVIGYRDTAPPDVISLMLAHAVRIFNVDVNLDAWTRIFGLLFVGALILVRMRAVLANLSTVSPARNRALRVTFFFAQSLFPPLFSSFGQRLQEQAQASSSCFWQRCW